MITLELDIDMPETCGECPFNYDFINCMADKEQRRIDYDKKMEFCPLKEKQTNTAEWIKLFDEDGSPTMEEVYAKIYKCSNCGIEDFRSDYCPNCGARMKGENQ